MEKIKLIAAIAVSTLLFTACDKEEGVMPNSGSNAKSSTNTKGVQDNFDKSGMITDSDVVDYVDVLIGESEPGVTYDLKTTLLLLETAVNVEIGTLGAKSYYKDLLEIEVDLAYNESGGKYSLEPDVLDYFNEIKDSVTAAFENSAFYATHGSSSFISVIDFDGLEEYKNSPLDHVKIFISVDFDFEPVVPFCTFDNDWRAGNNLGDCSATYAGDATTRLQSMATNQTCNSQFVVPGQVCFCSIYPFDIRSKHSDGSVDSRLWSGTGVNTCITKYDLNTIYKPGIPAIANDLEPTYNYWPTNDVGQINYYVYPSGGSVTAYHNLYVFYAKIIQHYI